MVILITTASRYMAEYSQDEQLDWSHYRLEIIQLHIGEPLFYPATAAEKSASAPPSQGELPPEGRSRAGLHKNAAPRSLELPTPPAAAKNMAVILQPDFEPLPASQVVLPPLAFWARQGADLPKPPPLKQVVVPGRTEASSATPKLGAAPVLAVPNREQAVANLNASLPQTPSQTAAALPVANSATIPVRVRSATEVQAATFEISAGDAANVLAMATDWRQLKDVQIPRGLQNIPQSDGNTGGDDLSNAPINDGVSNRRNAGSGSPARDTSNRAGAANPSGRSAPAKPNRGTDPGQGNPGGNSMAGDATIATGSRPLENTVNSAPRLEVTRIAHPANGSFDVVIVQSSTGDDSPDIAGILSGNPVYSVYLSVGDRKEWLLEYCGPAPERSQSNPYQINIEDAAPLTPPYPISTTIPATILGQPIPKHILVHGVLTADGVLRNMKALDTNSPLVFQILALLSDWQFRPALRSKKPVDLEILLVIPSRG